MTYQDQYKHPKWQKKRLEILEKSRFECESCGDDTKTLHIHHRIYRKGHKVWEYEDHEFSCLCEDCHKSEHEILDHINEMLVNVDGGSKEAVAGFIAAIGCPMFLRNGDQIEYINGKILGYIYTSKLSNYLESIVVKDIIDGNLDKYGESPALQKVIEKFLEVVK